MDNDVKEYQLRCQLRGHTYDVRRICICGNAGIVTSSKDKTVRLWTLDESQNCNYTMSRILLGHTGSVGALAWIPPNEEFPGGGVISGGMDKLIIVWNLATGEQVQLLRGHNFQVMGVAFDGSDIISVSFDCTLRRWREGQQVEVSYAHRAPTQAIVTLPSGEFVTGASDKTLKLWRGNSCVHTFLGHTDSVRGVAVMPNLAILSASLDRTIKMWSLSGELLMEMVGHTSFVNSVDAHVSGLIVSGSEDYSAKIWKDGVCVQTIDHPGCVWDAKFLENGDIVTACSDSFVRIWTLDNQKIVGAFEVECYKAKVESTLKDRIEEEINMMHAARERELKLENADSDSDTDKDLEFSDEEEPVEPPDRGEWLVAQMRPLETIADVIRHRLGEVGVDFATASYRFLRDRGLVYNNEYWTRERLQHIVLGLDPAELP